MKTYYLIHSGKKETFRTEKLLFARIEELDAKGEIDIMNDEAYAIDGNGIESNYLIAPK